MPPIPIYSQSPINAAKASGTTPQTADTERTQKSPGSSFPNTTAAATAAAPLQNSPQQHNQYPPARPAAVPSIPAPTGSAQNQRYAPVQPTPAQPLVGGGGSPPPPQPGAVPVPPGGNPARSTPTLPPPPKAGETYQPPPPAQITPAPQPVPYPAQMRIPPPTGTAPGAQRGSSTAFIAQAPQLSSSAYPAALEHPPGYQQNIHASEFSSAQRAAHSAAESGAQRRSYEWADESGEGVWDSAKKLVQAAGEKLSAAESEVWRRINKD